jgi:hypothetical protein
MTINLKWIGFVKFKFHSNENIEWHCMQLELNWAQIPLNRNGMQIDTQSMKICSWLWSWKKTQKTHKFENTSFHPFFIWELAE